MTLTKGAKLGPYEILSPLGAGGMGEVYRARDSRLGREVAVKVLPQFSAGSAEALARFEREARAVAALSHPNILAIHDFGRDGDVAYSVTELLEGETLRERLASSAIPPRKAVEYAEQILRGLAAAHDRGIVHRDLKPDNLFLTRDGIVKILDFGIARETKGPSRGTNPESLTASGTVVGTPGYMSPEQIRGDAVDGRSDLFSAGVVLYELLSGKKPFLGRNMTEIMLKVITDPPPDLHVLRVDLPAWLVGVVERALAKRPEDRFASALEMTAAVRQTSETTADRTVLLPRAQKTLTQAAPGSVSVIAPALAQQAERELATHLGPIARVLVKRAQQAATSPEDFWRRLASHIERDGDRAAFLSKRHV